MPVKLESASPAVQGLETGVYPVSLNQEGHLLLEELTGSSQTLIPIGFTISSKTDRALLERAVNDLVQRHHSLRTSFVHSASCSADERALRLALFRQRLLFVPGMYLQIARDDGPIRISLRRAPSPDDGAIADVVEDEIAKAAASDTPHHLRAFFLESGRDDVRLIVLLSHLVADAWSVLLFCEELTATYAAYVSGRSSPLTPSPTQFGEFAAIQHMQVTSGLLKDDLNYWWNQWRGLEGAAVSHLHLPFAVTHHTSAIAPRIIQTRHVVDPDASNAVATAARKMGVTPYIVFRAALTVALAAYTGKSRVAFWANFDNRKAWNNGVVGWCANTHLVTAEAPPDRGFVQVCKGVAKATYAAKRHEALPLSALWQRTGRNLGVGVASRINFDSIAPKRPPKIDCDLTPTSVPGGMRWFQLDIRLAHEAGAFVLQAGFNSNLYSEEGVNGMLASVARVATNCAGCPDRTARACARLIA
jgi:hypothetical protein